MKIELIPIGKVNKINRQTLMYNAKILKIEDFQKELAELKEKYIILFDNGYYRPDSKEEYEKFIKKCNDQKNNTEELIKIAKKEMEEL